jgi:hypothetical protein
MKKVSKFLRMGSVAAVMLASTIVITALPAGAVTQSQVAAQFATLQNAVQSTQAYSSITGGWSGQEQSDLQSEANAIRSGNQSSERNYASAINNDSANVSNAMTGTLGWMNSVRYEYNLLKSEESSSVPGYQYARAEFPAATTLDNEALLAYGVAQSYFASQASLPPSGSGLWGLICLGTFVIGTVGAFYTGGLDAPAAESISRVIAALGVGCRLTGL